MTSHFIPIAALRFVAAIGFMAIVSFAAAAEPPAIPVGLDSYRQWERWPYQRIGARAYMRSTHDRTGGNESADASHFLYQESKTFNVTLDVEGPGVLVFARYNHWHGSPWHYEVDGKDHIVQETTSADPTKPVPNSVFLPADLFPNPLAWTWSVTKGADLMWVPIPFEKSFRMAYTRTRYGTGYYIVHQYVRGANLSQPIKAWDAKTPPDPAVLDLLRRAGTDIAPKGETQSGRVNVPKNGAVTVAKITAAPAMIRALEFLVPTNQAVAFSRASLSITWDKRPHPSVQAPVALFFGAGTLYNRDGREYIVKAFPTFIKYEGAFVRLACFFPMPFFQEAKIELIGGGETDFSDIQWSVRHEPFRDPRAHVGYFHATYRDHPNPALGENIVLLDTRKTEGGGDWSGSFIGTSFIFTHRNVLTTLEGDPRFYFDDSQSPQAYGTGTEEWGGGGDYWGGQNMTLPFAGHPVGARDVKEAKNDEDKIHSAYRFLLADLMPFGRNAVIHLEHGGLNQSKEHYKTVAYWYGAPGATLIKTDELNVGDAASEESHRYHSPGSQRYEVISRYEWGPDTYYTGFEKPQATPKNVAEFEFEADAGKPYHIWVRGRSLDQKDMRDSFWMQFNDDIGTDRIGSGYGHDKGFGNWLDAFPAQTYAWSSALPNEPPRTITFVQGGKQRLRIQPRHPGHHLEQIWLSSATATLPPEKHAPNSAADRSEIVIKAADARQVAGAIRTVADPSATTGQVLLIDGAGDHVVYPHEFRSPNQPDLTEAAGAGAVIVYPAGSDWGRKTTKSSEFTLKLDPKNLGVLLRRKLDYQFPNQRAQVSIADASKAGHSPAASDWKPAGAWYTAGANTYIYSDPRGELGETLHNVQTSNRRFRDDEFLVPRDLTSGRSAIRVRIDFTPVNRPLFPGHPLPELAWTELHYDAYCYVLAN